MRRIALATLFVTVSLAAAARACGPWLPTTYLAHGHSDRVLAMPEGDFFHELYRLADLPEKPAENRRPFTSDQSRQNTIDADAADLDAALRQRDVADEDRKRIVREYSRMRGNMHMPAGIWDSRREPPARPRPGERLFDLAPYEPLLKEVPPEFVYYVRGAAALADGETREAVAQWRRLVDLPETHRTFRSTWAAFMIGKVTMADDQEEAVKWFERTRALAKAGCRDTLHLADASLGWQARAELDLGRRAAAMGHYFQMFRDAGEPERTIGYTSLCAMCRAAFAYEAAPPDDLAADPLCRRIATAWVLSRETCTPRDRRSRWIDAVEKAVAASGEQAVPGADRLAWAAYRAGRMDTAARWAALADADAPYARWVRSKLLLRQGKIDDALALLRDLTKAFPPRRRLAQRRRTVLGACAAQPGRPRRDRRAPARTP